MPGTPDCFICRRQAGKEEQPPGGYIHTGKYFLVSHAPLEMTGTIGTLIVESKRHLLDFGEMRRNEGTNLTEMLRKLFPAMKHATGAERIYSLATMDEVPHFHLWLVPWKRAEGLRGVRYLASEKPPPSLKEVEQTISIIKKALGRV